MWHIAGPDRPVLGGTPGEPVAVSCELTGAAPLNRDRLPRTRPTVGAADARSAVPGGRGEIGLLAERGRLAQLPDGRDGYQDGTEVQPCGQSCQHLRLLLGTGG